MQTLDGFGRLVSPPPLTEPVSIANFDKLSPSAKHPPGIYGTSTSTRVINVVKKNSSLRPIENVPSSATTSDYMVSEPLSLKPWLLLAAFLLFCLDIIATALLTGGLRKQRTKLRPASSFSIIALATLVLATTPATQTNAQSEAPEDLSFALEAALKTRLAYVVTGNPEIDDVSEKGLAGLSRVIAARTAIEPGEPMGVDVTQDELAFFPVLYWPIPDNSAPLSNKTLARIDAYMKQGGMIVFDTRDHQQSINLGNAGTQGAGSRALQTLIGKLDIPRLEPVPAGHVLTKSFYLLNSFPGRWDGGELWVEARSSATQEDARRARLADGVSSILITSNDFATAWALDDQNRPLFPVVPGAEVQREMAFRSGINILMYALTGNYKADQVHVPALLERLGQ